MSDTFTVTKLSYDEASDTLSARAYQSRFQDETYASESDAQVVVEIETAFCANSSIRLVSTHYIECEADFLPTVLVAFCRAFQNAHDEQNPGDNPGLTALETFDVAYH